jgi:hypothetical protein
MQREIISKYGIDSPNLPFDDVTKTATKKKKNTENVTFFLIGFDLTFY